MNTTNTHGDAAATSPIFMIFCRVMERFGYYGVQGVLAVFFVKQFVSQEQVFVTFVLLLRWFMASFPLVAMLATTCWGPNAPLFSEHLCWRIGYFMTGMSLLKPDLIFIARDYRCR